MNCHSVRKIAFEYISGEVRLARELELRRHTSSCADCRTYLKSLLEEEQILEQALAPSRPSSRRARRIVAAVLRSRRPVPRVRFVPALSAVRSVALFAGAALLMLCAILALINQVSSPAVGKDAIDYHPFVSRPVLQMRLGLTSPSRVRHQTDEDLADIYADLYLIAAEGLGKPAPAAQAEGPKETPPGEEVNPDRPDDGALVPSGRLTWKLA